MYLSVIILAAGSSRRIGYDKLGYSLGGETVLERTIGVFASMPEVNEIILVGRKENEEYIKKVLFEIEKNKVVKFTCGGETRSESVRSGLRALAEESEYTAIHDAARPFITPELVRKIISALPEFGAATSALPLKDTIVYCGENAGTAVKCVERSEYRAVQTPQIFKTSIIKNAYQSFDTSFTDDCSIVLASGGKIKLVEGDEDNFKITTPRDIVLAEGKVAGMNENSLRIGHGYDAHRFAEGRKLILCGIEIDYSSGLEGHSDADAPIHALIDALFGAAGLGDIGSHFPPSDDAYLGISSVNLLVEALCDIKSAGFEPVNADITIIAQKPRLLKYIPMMKEYLSEKAGFDINVKATTEEGMGFTGRLEGISAHAVALVRKV